MRPFFFWLVAMGATLAPGRSRLAAETRFTSGTARVSLLELFTSEGCSSCPPAERWLSSLREAPGLWRDFVPLAFHVNYWDRLGWPDRFASREFTDRERAYAAAWNSVSVYTPCFVRDGAEWHPNGSPPAPLPEKTGVLTAALFDAKTCRVEFTPKPADPKENLEVHIAILGSGFVSKVTAGENRGETLLHEFVVLALESHPLARNAERDVHEGEFALPRGRSVDAPRSAIAVWVTRRGGLSPLQAVGGWLDR